MVALSLQDVGVSRGGRTLFADLGLVVQEKERIGLIGRNGCGKSTLLSVMAGSLEPDTGEVIRSAAFKIGVLSQFDRFDADSRTVEEVVCAEVSSAEAGSAYRALSICGFEDPQAAVAGLSGGWRKRLAFARMMAKEPVFLLLDEPTNHLDAAGLLWLQDFLERFEGGYLMVTHDRHMLQAVCSRIVELNSTFRDGLLSVQGNYRRFKEVRSLRIQELLSEQQRLKSQTRRENEWLQAGVKARTTKSRSRIDRAHGLNAQLHDVSKRIQGERSTEVSFTTEGHQSGEALHFEQVALERGGKCLFKGFTHTLRPGDRLGLVGPNGSGKSSLLQLILGELQPTEGTVRRAPALEVSYFDQHRQQFEDDCTLAEALCSDGDHVLFQGKSYHVISWAERFLFSASQLRTKVGELSGGERARVTVASIMTQTADVLVLDEPTNDLDIWMLEAFEDALQQYPGVVIIVSHDRYFLESICTSYVALDGEGAITAFADYEQWAQQVKKAQRKKKESGGASDVKPVKAPSVKKVSKKKLSYKEAKELESLEVKIPELEKQIETATAALQSGELASDPDALREMAEQLHVQQEQLDSMVERWAELEELREAAEG